MWHNRIEHCGRSIGKNGLSVVQMRRKAIPNLVGGGIFLRAIFKDPTLRGEILAKENSHELVCHDDMAAFVRFPG